MKKEVHETTWKWWQGIAFRRRRVVPEEGEGGRHQRKRECNTCLVSLAFEFGLSRPLFEFGLSHSFEFGLSRPLLEFGISLSSLCLLSLWSPMEESCKDGIRGSSSKKIRERIGLMASKTDHVVGMARITDCVGLSHRKNSCLRRIPWIKQARSELPHNF